MPRTVTHPPSTTTLETAADLLKRLGNIPPERVRIVPAPGTATEADVVRHRETDRRLFELVDGTLVEKTMGFEESAFTVVLTVRLGNFVLGNNLGVVAGADGIVRLTTGLVRIPDVSFVSWDRLPGRTVPRGPIPQLVLDLAVEVVSQGNTRAEMARKVTEYLDAGTRLVWLIDPRKRTAVVHAPGVDPIELDDGDSLEGGDVLPGFTLPLSTLFDRAARGPEDPQ